MSEIQELINNLRSNEAIAQKLFHIETSILSCHSSKELLYCLLDLIKEKFSLSQVYLLLAQPSPIPHLFSISEGHFLDHQQVYHGSLEKLQRLLVNNQPYLTNKVSLLEQFISRQHLTDIQSVAVVPLQLEDKIFGALLMGDANKQRFHPGLGTYHLQQLAVKASLCLANVLAREKLEFLACHDSLTGLYNRRRMEETIRSELMRQQRYQQAFSILFVDCNKFKAINDRYGHDCGDEVLKYIATNLKRLLRGNDSAFRFAGDEFVITLINQNAKQSLYVANRLSNFFRQNPMDYNGQNIEISISCGIAESDGRQSMELLLKRADKQLYRQKNIELAGN
jgi:diguanylate cyclase (GGDEF)-like protein